VIDPVVDVRGHAPVEDDKSNVKAGVEDSPKDVGTLSKNVRGLSGHKEGHVSDPHEGKGSESSHLEGA